MGRHSHKQSLVIWLNGTPVGTWQTSGADHSLTYFSEWLMDEQARPLSLSLPLRPPSEPYKGTIEGSIVGNYFDNLLPDSDQIRKRLATRFKTHDTSPHHLLAAIGRDCVGAVQLLQEDETPHDLFTIQGEPLDQAGVADILKKTVSTTQIGSNADEDDLRISIAGAQEKTALLWHANAWYKPLGSTPTTHILKLPLGLVGNAKADFHTSVENEWLCSKILAAFGLPVARTDIGIFEDQKALIVERFDRRLAGDGSWIVRLPQEDFCQVEGISPLKKYQNEGGPGITQIMNTLRGSTEADADRFNFFKTQIIFWLLAAIDGHAKNYSVFLLPGAQFKLTPAYDVLSAHPVLGSGPNQFSQYKVKLAMAVKGTHYHYKLMEVQKKHWVNHAAIVGLGDYMALSIIDEIGSSTEKVIDQVSKQIPDEFPHKLADAIFAGMRAQCAKL